MSFLIPGLRRRAVPFDWASHATTAACGSKTEHGIDVIVPVFGALSALRCCLASIQRHTELEHHRLVLVLDGPPPEQEEVHGILADLGLESPTVLANSRRLGYAGSINKAIAQGSRDMVWLNSDTVVSSRWLDKLARAAASRPEVGTVTPFSNNGSICSLPRHQVENDLPTGYDVDSFAALVEASALPEYPPIPTGVGFCMYVRREMLDRVGPLREDAFGLGYGEEVELCMRGLESGFVHLLDDSTFVYHSGQGSFGSSRSRRVRRAEGRLRRLQPRYWPTISAFLRQDPLAGARNRVLEALSRHAEKPVTAAASPRTSAEELSVVHLVHGWPPRAQGGTELYAYWLAHHQAASRHVAVYTRTGDVERSLGDTRELLDRGIRVRFAVNNFTQRNPIARNALHEPSLVRDFRRFLQEERPSLVHVHHLAGHCLTMVDAARSLAIPYVLQLQDWWLECARANFWHPRGELCSGSGLARCASCLPMTAIPPSRLLGSFLYLLRRLLARRAIQHAAALVAGSRFIESSLRHHGLVGSGRQVHVIPYGVPLADADIPPRGDVPTVPLRFGIVGTLMPHKGVHVAVEAFRGIPEGAAILEIWGDDSARPDYVQQLQRAAAGAPIHLRGTFPEEGKDRLLRSLDALIVPSVGLESFGLVAREALACGTPVIASRRGALRELEVEGSSWVRFFDPEAPDDLRLLVQKFIAEPSKLRPAGNPMQVASPRSQAESIDTLYDGLSRGSKRGNRP